MNNSPNINRNREVAKRNESENRNLNRGRALLLDEGFEFINYHSNCREEDVNKCEPIGRGGGGETYCVRYIGNNQNDRNRLFAVKIFKKTKSAEQEKNIVKKIV